jgi:hypothetical protein
LPEETIMNRTRRTFAVFALGAVAALSLPALALAADDAKDSKDAQPAAAQEKPEGYTDTPMQPNGKWHVHDPNRPQPPVVTPGKQFSQMADAPSDAVVLFDGKDFSKWQGEKGRNNPTGEVKWKLENGYMETTSTGVIRTKDEFGDFQMHLEFATPSTVVGKGQGRGNNGVNIYGQYEIQVLDSYNNKTYPDGQASAIYGQYPPQVNASRPPGEWQTYDIIWEAPRWDTSGKLVKKAHATVLHNGVLVHHDRELFGRTGHRMFGNYDKPQPPHGFIQLYEHGNPVRFRNIWIRPIRTDDSQEGKNEWPKEGQAAAK